MGWRINGLASIVWLPFHCTQIPHQPNCMVINLHRYMKHHSPGSELYTNHKWNQHANEIQPERCIWQVKRLKGHEDLCMFSLVTWIFNLSWETDLKTFEKRNKWTLPQAKRGEDQTILPNLWDHSVLMNRFPTWVDTHKSIQKTNFYLLGVKIIYKKNFSTLLFFEV